MAAERLSKKIPDPESLDVGGGALICAGKTNHCADDTRNESVNARCFCHYVCKNQHLGKRELEVPVPPWVCWPVVGVTRLVLKVRLNLEGLRSELIGLLLLVDVLFFIFVQV